MARRKILQRLSPARRMVYAAACLWAAQAQAGALTNLDSKAYTFNISIGGEMQAVTLEPGRTWRSHAAVPMLVHADDGTLKIDADEEYAIWKGGKIMLQSRKRQNERGR